LLVYVRDEGFVIETLKRIGFSDVKVIGFERQGTQCFVAHHEKFVVVSFRGTETAEPVDILTDLDLILSEHKKLGKVHNGFRKALNEIWNDLYNYLQENQNNRTLWFTGHSLGAALATLASHWMDDVQGVYTFGSPRVGDRGFKEHYRVNTYRFVNNNDIVTRVPLPLRYRHVGNLKYIDSEGNITSSIGFWGRFKELLSGGLKHRLKIIKQFSSHTPKHQVIIDQLVDHAPIFYTNLIWNHYTKSLQQTDKG